MHFEKRSGPRRVRRQPFFEIMKHRQEFIQETRRKDYMHCVIFFSVFKKIGSFQIGSIDNIELSFGQIKVTDPADIILAVVFEGDMCLKGTGAAFEIDREVLFYLVNNIQYCYFTGMNFLEKNFSIRTLRRSRFTSGDHEGGKR